MSLVSEVVETAIVRILKPLIRILLRNGIAYATFADIARKVYVDNGFEEAKRQGQRQTVSNVSIMTGINRKEVKRLREADAYSDDNSLKKLNRIARVLAGWQHDEEFLDDQGEPKTLQLEGERGSFSRLVKRYSGDMPVVAMLNSLLDGNSIRVLDDGDIKLINRNYLPKGDPENKVNILGIDTAELISTIDHNISIGKPEEAWFQRKASNTFIKCDALPGLRQQFSDQAQHFLEQIDSTLSSHESGKNEPHCAVSLGIYYYQTDEESD